MLELINIDLFSILTKFTDAIGIIDIDKSPCNRITNDKGKFWCIFRILDTQ